MKRQRGPLGGLRVLDLTHHIAGPYATRLLAGYGAEVIKVERPPAGDAVRAWQPRYRDANGREQSALFAYLNAGKTSVSLNLKWPEGRAALLRLTAVCDLVVENFMPGAMERLGLAYDDLRAVRPDIVLVSISNFGRQGPFHDYEATELTVFALGGRMAASGVRPQPPVRLLGGASEYMAGTIAAGAALVALAGRDRDGGGDHLDISIAGVILGEPDRGLCLYGYSGTDPERPDAPRPFQIFPAADGFVVINVNRGIERIMEMIGRPELAADPRFASNIARQEHASQLEAVIIEWTVSRTKAEIVAEAGRFRAIASPVNTVPEVLDDPHLRARRYFRTVTGADGRPLLVPGPPFRLHACPEEGWRPHATVPAYGEDTTRVLAQIAGLSRRDLAYLVASGAAFDPALPLGMVR